MGCPFQFSKNEMYMTTCVFLVVPSCFSNFKNTKWSVDTTDVSKFVWQIVFADHWLRESLTDTLSIMIKQKESEYWCQMLHYDARCRWATSMMSPVTGYNPGLHDRAGDEMFKKDDCKDNLHLLHVGLVIRVAFGSTLRDAKKFIVESIPVLDGQCAAAVAKAVGELNSTPGRSTDGWLLSNVDPMCPRVHSAPSRSATWRHSTFKGCKELSASRTTWWRSSKSQRDHVRPTWASQRCCKRVPSCVWTLEAHHDWGNHAYVKDIQGRRAHHYAQKDASAEPLPQGFAEQKGNAPPAERDPEHCHAHSVSWRHQFAMER